MNILQQDEVINSADLNINFDKVKGLDIRDQSVHYMPKFSELLAQSLEVLYISHCHLKSINRDDLKQFPNLRMLYLANNDLVSLDSNLFEFTTKLEVISFSWNKLTFIGVNILGPTKNLSKIWFIESGCVNYYAEMPVMTETVEAELQAKCGAKEIREAAALRNQNDELEKKNDEFSNVIAKLRQEVTSLELKISEEQEKSREMETNIRKEIDDCVVGSDHLSHKFKSCDKNLDGATRSLAKFDATSAEEHNIDAVCVRYSEESKACWLINFVTAKSRAKFVSVKDEYGQTVQPTRLIMWYQSVLYMPANLHQIFPDLDKIDILGSGLFDIDKETFKGLGQLTYLNMTRNKMLSIVSDSFSDLRKLTKLDLSHNNLETIEADAFRGLDKLKVLHLNGNKLSEINANIFSMMNELEKLDLRGNLCVDSEYPEMALAEIKLKVHDKCVPPITINCILSNSSQACHAENLRIVSPKTKILKTNAMSENVSELFIEDQVTFYLPFQLDQMFPKLQKLAVIHSQLKLLVKIDFIGLVYLKWLEIRGNNLTLTDSETFHALPQLELLDLSSNGIQSLPLKIFEPLTRLKEIRLSFNSIRVLEANVLPTTNVIKVFRMDNNKLEIIDANVLHLLKHSDEIDLQKCGCIDVKYQKNAKPGGLSLRNLFGDVAFSCSQVI